jgi:hypothetical protein
VLKFEGAPPSMTEAKLITLLKRTIKVENFKVKVKTPKGISIAAAHMNRLFYFVFLFLDLKKSSTISGEIWFSTASQAIEVVMEINYAIFWNKGMCTLLYLFSCLIFC